MSAGTGKKKALKSGLYKLPSSPEDKGYLIGRKCKGCGTYFWPDFNNPTPRSICPLCYSQDIEEVPLSTRGKVWSYAISYELYPDTPFPPPLIAAEVELPETVGVTTAIVECDPGEIKIGMEVELDFVKVAEDKEGDEIMAFVFKPVRR